MMDWERLSNPCAHPLRPGAQVRFMVVDVHHGHGCVEKVVPKGAWVALDNGEKLFIARDKLRVENPHSQALAQRGFVTYRIYYRERWLVALVHVEQPVTRSRS